MEPIQAFINGINWSSIGDKAIKILIILVIAKILVKITSPNSKMMNKVKKHNKSTELQKTTIIVSKIIKIGIYVITAFMIIAELGYDLNGLVTGLGLGSVVIALAAQELVSNMFSGMAIASEKPFEIGDFVTIGGYSGYVVDIKFRSVKIRTLENTMLTIQNTKILNEYIINYAEMKGRRLEFNLRLPLNTKKAEIEVLIDNLKTMLYSNEQIRKGSVQINIDEIQKDAIILNSYMYLTIIDFEEFINFKSKILLDVIHLLEAKNIKLAYPVTEIAQKNLRN
mgnify:FL=1